MNRTKGAITVEATIILPLYILLMVFLINFLNVFYLQQTIQFGMNNAASVLAQYCYVVDKTIGMEHLTLSSEQQTKAADLYDNIVQVGDTGKQAIQSFSNLFEGGNLLNKLEEVGSSAKEFSDSISTLSDSIKAVTGEDLVDCLLTGGLEAGGGMLIEVLVDDYLEQMNVNLNYLDGEIKYALYVDPERYDLIVKASYCYADPLFSVFTKGFRIEQQVCVHPWIGGETDGLRGKLIG